MTHLGCDATKNTHFFKKKKLQMKGVQNWIAYKKSPRAQMSSSYGAEPGTSKDWYDCYIILLKLQMTLHLGFDAMKNTHFQKKLHIKVVQIWISYKKVPERMCLSPYRAEPGASKDWYGCYIILLKLQMTFHLGHDATKNMHFFKKKLQMKVHSWLLLW